MIGSGLGGRCTVPVWLASIPLAVWLVQLGGTVVGRAKGGRGPERTGRRNKLLFCEGGLNLCQYSAVVYGSVDSLSNESAT